MYLQLKNKNKTKIPEKKDAWNSVSSVEKASDSLSYLLPQEVLTTNLTVN